MNQPDDLANSTHNLAKKPQQQRHLPWVDALRGLAIFGVLICHAGQQVENLPSFLGNLTYQGAVGVQLFYMISAFTLFLSLTNRKKIEKKPLVNFFMRRFFRIAPLFYCAIVFYMLTTGMGPNYWIEDGKSITIPNLITHLTFTNGWNPYWINSLVPVGWSIAIEMPFYLIVPYLFKKIKTINQAIWLTLIVLLLSKLVNYILSQNPLISDRQIWDLFLVYWLPSQLPFFALGIVLYFLLVDTIKQPSAQVFLKSQLKKTITPLFLISLSLAVFSYISKTQLGMLGFLYGIALLSLAVFLSQHSVFWLVNKFWCYLGKISYSAYLTHLIVLYIIKNFLQKALLLLNLNLPPTINLLLLLGFLLVGTIAISEITYKFIELPGLQLGRIIIAKIESKA
ncbi:MAG: acyltransferase [Coleofasciculaceae cyanobacterium]